MRTLNTPTAYARTMRLAFRRCLLLVLFCLLVVGAAGGAAADDPTVQTATTSADVTTAVSANATAAVSTDATSAVSTDATSATSDALIGEATTRGDQTIEFRQELQRTPERGEYTARHHYRIPDGVVELEVELPGDATVTDASGFDRVDRNTYAWDGTTDRPSVTYRMPADQTIEREGPIAGPGEYLFVDRGDWALVTRPQVSHAWSWIGGDVRLDRQVVADGQGAVGEVMAFLGPHEEYQHAAHGQTFRLIVPEAATLAEDPDAILASLEHASDSLRVGARDREVFVVAAPTGEIEWGVRGLQIGSADVWVRDAERLEDPDNVWLHEYVHTRQNYATTDSARWFDEGAAVYYAALLTLEQEHIEFDQFRQRLARGTSPEFDGERLAEPQTWQRNPDYHVGALVAGELDRQIRLATDGERSLQNVFQRMNERGDPIDASRFERFLREEGGDDVERLGNQYTRTTARPTTWNAAQHGEAFGTLPARFSYELAGIDAPGAYRVDGPYRSGSIDGDPPIVLVPGETLTLEATVRNTGGTAGEYETVFCVDGEPQDRRRGRLDPDQSREVTFDHEFTDVGEHTVAVGDATVTVSVREPARARVVELAADRTTATVGETITLTITVSNDAALPGEIELPITASGDEIDRELVRLDAGDRQTVTVEHTVEDPGTVTFEVGDAAETSVQVTEEPTPTPEPEQPGFGVVAVAAVLGMLVLTLQRRLS